ncbi:MAG: thiol reductant ABC exporter subunit CydC [Micrococcales bacterium]|nr:thiol reductant ABC exporter subunit CydC [Micrococcales bacterium]
MSTPATQGSPAQPTPRRGAATTEGGTRHTPALRHRGLTFRGPLRLAGLLGGLALACGVALTATSGWLIVQASSRPPVLSLLVAIVAVRTFGIARPLFRYWERLRSHDAALAELAAARVDTYRRLIPLTPARLGRRARSDVLSAAVKDLDDEVEAQVRVVVPLVASLFAGLVAIAYAASVHLPAAAAITALVLLLAGIVWLLARLEDSSQREGLEARAQAHRVAALVTTNAHELQAIGAGGDTDVWLDQAHERVRRAASRQGLIRALAAALMLVCIAGATAGIALLVEPSVGTTLSRPVAALLLLIPLALGEITAPLPEAMGALARSRAAAARLQGLVTQEPAVAQASAPDRSFAQLGTNARGERAQLGENAGGGTRQLAESALREGSPDPSFAHLGTNAPGGVPRLELRGVSAGWVPGRTDIGPIDLVIEPGDHVALVGPNGAGKSTLLAVLARHLDPSGGAYLIDGEPADARPLEVTRAAYAIVDDEPHLFTSTVRENLRLARPEASDAEIEQALDAAGLRAWRTHLRAGLETMLGEGNTGVSGGERARIAIARALLSQRPVLLLDEPVAHLDHPTAEAVLADLFAASAGRTVVMVSHREEGTQYCGRIVPIGGRLEEAGPSADGGGR